MKTAITMQKETNMNFNMGNYESKTYRITDREVKSHRTINEEH